MTSLHLERTLPYKRGNQPTIVVRLAYGDCQIDTEAMLDTGASVCVFDASLAHVLGVPLTRGRQVPIVGLDGTIRPAPLVLLDLTVLPVSAGISLGQIPIAFLDGIQRTVGNLLGRQRFFSAVDLGLSHARRTIHLGLSSV